jgi:hypothetical protein
MEEYTGFEIDGVDCFVAYRTFPPFLFAEGNVLQHACPAVYMPALCDAGSDWFAETYRT